MASQVRVASKVLPQWPAVLVTVLTIEIVLLPLLSVAVGASKVQALPNSTVLFVLLLQSITGALVLTQASTARQMRVASKVLPQCPAVLVTVLTMLTLILLPPSIAVGGSKVH